MCEMTSISICPPCRTAHTKWSFHMGFRGVEARRSLHFAIHFAIHFVGWVALDTPRNDGIFTPATSAKGAPRNGDSYVGDTDALRWRM